MEVYKNESTLRGAVNEDELAQINAFARSDLRAEEVYAFAVKLCDNEVDRDGERFPRATLEELAPLFVGKSGIFDHAWSAEGQTARIYRTELCEGEGETAAGERYCYLKGWAYMLRSEKNAELIAEIEGGIKKEVSVGCSVRECRCSVCGGDIAGCGHEKGRRYGGKLCFAELIGAQDAYEWSFVAVPAQRNAGVMKRFAQETQGDAELKALAALGRRYLTELRAEVKRLLLVAEETLDGGAAERIADALDEPELRELARVYGARTAKKLGLAPQIPDEGTAADAGESGSEFRI